MFIGLAGSAFNQSKELEMGFGDTIQIGQWRIVCQSFSQDSNPTFDTDYALLDVFHGARKITQLTPERRFYIASQTPSTMVAVHSTLARDLYVVFEGRNPETDRPIIKVFLNPLVNWIWIGVFIVILGTLIALTPSLQLQAPHHRIVISTVAQRPVPARPSHLCPFMTTSVIRRACSRRTCHTPNSQPLTNLHEHQMPKPLLQLALLTLALIPVLGADPIHHAHGPHRPQAGLPMRLRSDPHPNATT